MADLRFKSAAPMAVWLVLTGCAMPLGLPAETTYVIEDLDEETQRHFERALRSELAGDGFTLLDQEPASGRLAFRVARSSDAMVMRRVQSLIESLGRDARVPVVLQEASLRYASVQGRGRAEIVAAGRATPGAVVLLDVGAGLVSAAVGLDGQWSAHVERTAKLRERGGWIYGLVVKGEARQFLAINVLDTAASRPITREELPPDSALRQR